MQILRALTLNVLLPSLEERPLHLSWLSPERKTYIPRSSLDGSQIGVVTL